MNKQAIKRNFSSYS